jgi:hypothetical protein
MPASAPGKLGLLQPRFEVQGGRTRLSSVYASGLQRVQRALYLDAGMPGMAFAFIQSLRPHMKSAIYVLMAAAMGSVALPPLPCCCPPSACPP